MKTIHASPPFSFLMRAAAFALLGIALTFGVSRAALAACVGGVGNGTVEPGEQCESDELHGLSVATPALTRSRNSVRHH